VTPPIAAAAADIFVGAAATSGHGWSARRRRRQ